MPELFTFSINDKSKNAWQAWKKKHPHNVSGALMSLVKKDLAEIKSSQEEEVKADV